MSALAASVPTIASAPTMASAMPTRLMAVPMKSALRAADAADASVHLPGLRRMRPARRVYPHDQKVEANEAAHAPSASARPKSAGAPMDFIVTELAKRRSTAETTERAPWVHQFSQPHDQRRAARAASFAGTGAGTFGVAASATGVLTRRAAEGGRNSRAGAVGPTAARRRASGGCARPATAAGAARKQKASNATLDDISASRPQRCEQLFAAL